MRERPRGKCLSSVERDAINSLPDSGGTVANLDGWLPGRQRAGGSASLWPRETTGADCACPVAARIDRLMSHRALRVGLVREAW